MHPIPLDHTIRNAIVKTIAASLTAYIAVFGLQDKGYAKIPPTEAAMKQEQASKVEPNTYHLFEAAVKPELTLDFELITDHPFEKEATEEADRTDYEVAKILAIEGSRRLGHETEIDGSYLLKKSLQKWEEIPKEKIKGIPASEYAATQYALAYFYVHSTLNAYFEEDNPYPNSLERLQKEERASTGCPRELYARRTDRGGHALRGGHRRAGSPGVQRAGARQRIFGEPGKGRGML